MRRTILSVAGAVSLAAAAQAQGAADPAAELAAKQWQLDMLKLQVEQKKAEKELVGVQVEALGLKGAEGKTTGRTRGSSKARCSRAARSRRLPSS
jgi:hypothetical protein